MKTAGSETTAASDTQVDTAPPEAKRYQGLKLTASLASLAVSLSFLATVAFLAGPHVDHRIRGWLGDNRWLRLIVLAFVYAVGIELLTLPLDFWSGFVLEHRYQLSNETLAQWIWRRCKGYLVGGLLGLFMIVGLYALLWYGGAWWWLWAAAAWLGVSLILGQWLPVVILPLFYRVTPLEDPALLERLERLARGTGLRLQGIFRLHLSAQTRKANAALAGLGRTRRVLLGDTLLEQFTPDEIEVVFAHELGHHVYHHLPKMASASVVSVAASFWLADQLLKRLVPMLGYPLYDEPVYQEPGALPLLLLVLAVFALVITPLQNAVSRHFERQCDRYALTKTGLVQAYRTAFIKLARVNKADMDPHPLLVCLFEDHPPIRQRLAMAEALRDRR